MPRLCLSVLLHPAQEFCVKQSCFLILRDMAASLENTHGQITKVRPERIPGCRRSHEKIVASEGEEHGPIECIQTLCDINLGEDLSPHALNHFVEFDSFP